MTHRSLVESARIALLVISVSAVLAPDAAAQAPPFVLEVRGGASIPIGSFADGARPAEGATADRSFGMAFGVTRTSTRTTFVGFSQHRFACEDAGCDTDGSFVATNVEIGMRFNVNLHRHVIPWIRVGGLTTRVELGDHPDYPDAVSSLGYGGEIGAGVYLGAAGPVGLSPGVRVTAVNSGLPDGGLLRMRYLVADVAVVIAF